MTAPTTIRNFNHKCYSVLMLLALIWLTISLPFVYAQQQAQKANAEKLAHTPRANDNSNPLTNTTEERSENGVNLPSEYLHETHTTAYPSSLIVKAFSQHSADLYVAFHPEYICPPPDTHVS